MGTTTVIAQLIGFQVAAGVILGSVVGGLVFLLSALAGLNWGITAFLRSVSSPREVSFLPEDVFRKRFEDGTVDGLR